MNLLHAFNCLLLPCRDNADEHHWMSQWEAALPNLTRVVQDEWVDPKLGPWAARLDEYVARCTRPVVLIAHSLGTSLIMHRAHHSLASRVAGAFMVAPSDRGPADIWPNADRNGFAPMILKRFPFPSMVLASRNDPYVAYHRAQTFAEAWGSDLVDMGQSGHMGNADRLGLWPQGLEHFGAFLSRIAVERKLLTSQ